MSQDPNRRNVLQGIAVGAAVVGFDPVTRRWMPDGRGPRPVDLDRVPPLDGELLTEPTALDAAADDFGHLVHRRPVAVLRPGSVADVVTMVRYCNKHRLPVAARGQGHATYGQAQVKEGLVIETTPLDHIAPIDHRTVTVGAGTTWSAVAKATLEHGLTPPVFTDYLELSVGGTLSVGGLGGQTHQHGAQVDNVTELRVVTGEGELLRCSAERHSDLFHAVLAGLGQCAIIVGATLRLERAPRVVRHYLLPYDDLRTFLEDQRRLIVERRFAYVEGQVAPDSAGAFRSYLLEAVAYGPPVRPGDDPASPTWDDERLLRGLRFDPSGVRSEDMDYYAFLDRLAPAVAALKAAGLWAYAHPWLNLLLPGRAATTLAAPLLEGLTADELGPGGVVLLYPLARERLRAGLLRVPDDSVPYLLAVLRACPPDDQATARRLLAANRDAYEVVRDQGGYRYPVGSVPFTRDDWRDHFGGAWHRLVAARRRYDPHGLLAPGQGVFPYPHV